VHLPDYFVDLLWVEFCVEDGAMNDAFFQLRLIDQFCVALTVAIFAMVGATMIMEYSKDLTLRRLGVTWGFSGFFVLSAFGLHATKAAEKYQRITASIVTPSDPINLEATAPHTVLVATKSGHQIEVENTFNGNLRRIAGQYRRGSDGLRRGSSEYSLRDLRGDGSTGDPDRGYDGLDDAMWSWTADRDKIYPGSAEVIF